jgi:hypothetical protein
MLGNGCKIGLRSTELHNSFEISSFFATLGPSMSFEVSPGGRT